VTVLNVAPGNMINDPTQPLVTIADLSTIWVTARRFGSSRDAIPGCGRAGVPECGGRVARDRRRWRCAEGERGAERAAQKSFELAQKQRALGTIGLVALLSAEQAYNNAALSEIQARANRYADTAALFQALGGGWWNPTEET